MNSRKLILATRNRGKVKELTSLLQGMNVEVLSLDHFPELPAVVEDGVTFEENALKKAKAVFLQTGICALADDSGLEVDALNGEPGVYSARYAGEDATDSMNNDKLLSALHGTPEELRTARFRCVVAYMDGENHYRLFEGECEGSIAQEPVGSEGFGYDPLFYLPSYGKTMAQLKQDEKNKISHRAEAMNAFLRWFRNEG